MNINFKAILKYIKYFYIAVIIPFLLYFLWDARDFLGILYDEADYHWLAIALVFWCVSHLVSPLLPFLIFDRKISRVTYSEMLEIHISMLPARYIPGGIWHTVGRVMCYRGLSIPAPLIAKFLVMENALAVFVTFLLGCSLLLLSPSPIASNILVLILILAAIAIVFFGKLLSIFSKGQVLSNSRYFLCVLVVTLFWIAAVFSFMGFFSGVSVIPENLGGLGLAGAYLISWGIGFVSIFAPQGIGVFEYILSFFLNEDGFDSKVFVLVACFRLIVLAADFITFLIGYVLSCNVRRLVLFTSEKESA